MMRHWISWLLAGLICLMIFPARLPGASLIWTGTNANQYWDTNTTVNWNNAGNPDKFLTSDSVTFDDTASTGNVLVSGTVQPASMTINNNILAYTFSGSGKIAGSTSLLKSGTGTLTISNTNTYTGGTIISAGTIIISNSSALSTSGTITLGDAGTGVNSTALLLTGSGMSYSRPIIVSTQAGGMNTLGRTSSGSGLVTISSGLTLNRDLDIQSSLSGTLSLTGMVTGSGSEIFTGGGITTWNCNSASWTGSMSIINNSMVLLLSASNAMKVSIDAGSGMAINNNMTFSKLTGQGYIGASGSGGPFNLTLDCSASSFAFDGTIGSASVANYAIRSAVNLVKTGTGTFTLTGSNNYTGTTTVSQGKLSVTGSGSISVNTPVTVASGATLAVAGAGSIASRSIVISSGGTLDLSAAGGGCYGLSGTQVLQAGRIAGFATDIVGNLSTTGTLSIAGSGTAGTMTIAGSLALNGGRLLFDLNNTTTAGAHVNDLISLTGSLVLSGTTTVVPNLLNGTLTNGTYTLISASSLAGGNASNLAWGGLLLRQAVTFDTFTLPGTVYMNVSGTSASLVWSGTNGNTWDANSTVNWMNQGTPDKFLALDSVRFDDTSTNGNVVVSGTVQPSSLVFNNSALAYRISGSGQIAGSTSLLKSGTGVLTVSNSNSYTGGTVISSGTIIVTNASALSTTGTITLGDSNTGLSDTALLSGSGTVFSRPIVISSQGGGTARLGCSGTGTDLFTIASPITLNRDTTFQALASGTITLALTGAWSGAGNAIFSGGGVTSLSGTLTNWTGNVFINGSSVLVPSSALFSSGSLSSATRNVDIAAGSALGFLTSGSVGLLTGAGRVGTGSGVSGLSLMFGAGNASSTFDGTIGGGIVAGYALGSSLNLTKIGAGILTLTGSSNYTGSTVVSQGTLALSGTGRLASTTAITVVPGALFDVSGLTGGTFNLATSQTLQAGRVSGFANDITGNLATAGTVNIAGSGTAGTLTIGGSLALIGGRLLFDFAGVTTAGSHVNDLISLGGSLSLSGTTLITPNLLNGSLANGTYTLITGLALLGGNASNLAWGGSNSRQNVLFDTSSSPGSVLMTVAGAPANLIWSGTNGALWDTNNTINWNNSGTPDKFFGADKVTFDDTAANGTVVVSGTVQPGSVNFNNTSLPFTISGTGKIAGTTSLLKSGTGALTISNANSYTGGTVISNGAIILANASALGTSGTVVLGDINTGSGGVALLSATAMTFTRPIIVASQSGGPATIGRSGTGGNLFSINSFMAINRDTTFLTAASATTTLALSGTWVGLGNAIFTGGGIASVSGSTLRLSAGNWTGNVFINGSTVLAASSDLFTSGSGGGAGSGRNVDVAAGSALAFGGGSVAMLTGSGRVGAITGGSNVSLTVGVGNASSTFDGIIGGGVVNGYSIGSSLSLFKTGNGVFTLSGTTNYYGATTIQQGTLALNGHSALATTSAITVLPGAVFDVSALTSGSFQLLSFQTFQAGRTSAFATDVTGNLSDAGGTLIVAGTGTAGTMTIGGDLAVNGGKLLFDLAGTTTAGSHVNDLISLTGTLSLKNNTVVVPNLLNSALATGTYTLIQSAFLSGSSGNLTWGGPASRQIISFDTTTTPGTVYLDVSGSTAKLTWSGTNGSTWDAASTVNWINTGFNTQTGFISQPLKTGSGLTSLSMSSPTGFTTLDTGVADTFYNLDNVTFSDASSNGSILVSGSLQPGSMIVNNNTTAYTFYGTGQIVGTTALVKSGTGTLTISTNNTFDGGTTINAGCVKLGSLPALGDASGSLTMNGGTLDLNGFDASVSALTGSSGAVITSGVSAPSTLTITTGTTSAFYGVIQNGAGVLSLTMAGPGKQLLAGTNTYTGATTISSGTLALASTGSINSSASVTVAPGAVFDVAPAGGFTVGAGKTLGGGGQVNGAVTIAAGGSLIANHPNFTVGSLTLSGTFLLTIDTGAAACGMVTATALNLINSPVLAISDIGGDQVLDQGTGFVILDYGAGTWNGGLFTFNGTTLNNGDEIVLGANIYQVTYNDTANGDNAVTLDVVPEPGVSSLVLAGILALSQFRVRAAKRATAKI